MFVCGSDSLRAELQFSPVHRAIPERGREKIVELFILKMERETNKQRLSSIFILDRQDIDWRPNVPREYWQFFLDEPKQYHSSWSC